MASLGPFETKRLSFRAVEGPSPSNNNDLTDLDYLHACNFGDPISQINSDLRIWRPGQLKDTEGLLKYLQDRCLLAVIICVKPEFDHLDPEDDDDDDDDESADDSKKSKKKKQKKKSKKSKKAKHRPIGMINLVAHSESRVHLRNSEIGLCLLKEYQGKGYGTESINWTLDWGFRQVGLHRIGIGHFSYNAGAGRLYRRLGFKPEGVKRDFLWYDGGWWDLIDLGMLEDEWRALRAGEKEKGEREGRVEVDSK